MRRHHALIHDGKRQLLHHVLLIMLESRARRARALPLVLRCARTLHSTDGELRLVDQLRAEHHHTLHTADALGAALRVHSVGKLVQQHFPDRRNPHQPLQLNHREGEHCITLRGLQRSHPRHKIADVLMIYLAALGSARQRRRRRRLRAEAFGDDRTHIRVERTVLTSLQVKRIDVRAARLPRLRERHLCSRLARLALLFGVTSLQMARVRLH
mmetsp:Transcript_4011/g.9060  ORF Transcript_4011/g.9060 Transcript_4011/m.9060 type:complete len:213 (+) Transcript_4011:407-1045(+)